MRHAGWRGAVVGALCVGIAVAAVPAVAAPPAMVDETTSIECSGTFGGRELSVTAYFYEDYVSGGGDAEFHDTTTDPVTPIWGNVAETSTYDGTNFVLDVAFTYGEPWGGGDAAAAAGEPGTPAGTMTITGTATPSGEPEQWSSKVRINNTWYWESGSLQTLAGAGAITGATGDVGFTQGADLACGGRTVLRSRSTTTPATIIWRDTYSTMDCPLAGPPESFLRLAFADWTYGEFAIGLSDGETGTAEWWAIGFGSLQWKGSAITGDLEVLLPSAYSGQAARLDLTVGSHAVDRGTDRSGSQDSAWFKRWVEYPLSGTVALPDGSEVEISGCALRTTWSMLRVSSPSGPKPGGKPPVNDLPDKALPLGPGTVEQSTRGAAVAPEAPCAIDSGGGPYEVAFGRTVWYTFTGTGQDVTISTLGSSRKGIPSTFHTVVGIYETDGAGPLVQRACATEGSDPMQPWAAEATISTTAGTRYLVQVGGVRHLADEVTPDPEWGDLVLTMR